MLVLPGLALAALAVWLMARSLLRPPRMSDGKAVWVLKRLSPGDFGMTFTDVSFRVRDAQTGGTLSVAAWWIACPRPDARGRCVVLIHGYADAKVGGIAWAPAWQSLGFHVLAIDLRAHGESGGDECTGGYFERHDVEQVVNELRATRPAETAQLVLFGVSLGGAVAAAAAERLQAAGAAVDAVVLDSPFTDFRHAAEVHMDHLGLPGRPFQQAAVRLAERLARADFAAVAPVTTLPRLACPVLVIAGASDPFLSPHDATALRAALASGSGDPAARVYWQVDGVAHLMALAADPQAYAARLGAFLSAALARPCEPVGE
jgi:pimeloyl-ACP methyl ester carboxylesterase